MSPKIMLACAGRWQSWEGEYENIENLVTSTGNADLFAMTTWWKC
jgi:hypothetical protein